MDENDPEFRTKCGSLTVPVEKEEKLRRSVNQINTNNTNIPPHDRRLLSEIYGSLGVLALWVLMKLVTVLFVAIVALFAHVLV